MSLHDSLIMQWDAATKRLETAKKEEMQLRLLLAHNIFNYNPELPKDTSDKLVLGRGWVLKADFKISHNLKDNVSQVLREIGKISEYYSHALVKWKSELNESEYKNLQNEEIKRLIDSVIVKKSRVPSIKLIEPKVQNIESPRP